MFCVHSNSKQKSGHKTYHTLQKAKSPEFKLFISETENKEMVAEEFRTKTEVGKSH